MFLALDLETTGLSPIEDRIVEVGAVKFDALGRELGRFESLVDPRRPMPPRARAVHGISDADLAVRRGRRSSCPNSWPGSEIRRTSA